MHILHALVSIGIAQLAGIIGSLFTASSVQTWYVTLAKPAWNPPSWLFGPVWTLLYTFMGIGAYLVWKRRERAGAKTALVVYAVHLVANTLWSVLFFGLQNPALAFGGIVVLLTLILITTALFWRIDRWAGMLMLPYIAWVVFASTLNYSIWQLNA